MTLTSSRSAAWNPPTIPNSSSWRPVIDFSRRRVCRCSAPRCRPGHHVDALRHGERQIEWHAGRLVPRNRHALRLHVEAFERRGNRVGSGRKSLEPERAVCFRQDAGDFRGALRRQRDAHASERNGGVLRGHGAFDDAARFGGHRRRAGHLLRIGRDGA